MNRQLFADDLCVWPQYKYLQRLPTVCCDHAAEQVHFIRSKKVCVDFPPKMYKQPAASGVSLIVAKFAEQVKYHSLLLHASLKDDSDIQRQVKSLYCAANKIKGTFCSVFYHSKKYFTSWLFNANVCLLTMEQKHTV